MNRELLFSAIPAQYGNTGVPHRASISSRFPTFRSEVDVTDEAVVDSVYVPNGLKQAYEAFFEEFLRLDRGETFPKGTPDAVIENACESGLQRDVTAYHLIREYVREGAQKLRTRNVTGGRVVYKTDLDYAYGMQPAAQGETVLLPRPAVEYAVRDEMRASNVAVVIGALTTHCEEELNTAKDTYFGPVADLVEKEYLISTRRGMYRNLEDIDEADAEKQGQAIADIVDFSAMAREPQHVGSLVKLAKLQRVSHENPDDYFVYADDFSDPRFVRKNHEQVGGLYFDEHSRCTPLAPRDGGIY